jgi:hypothetical protein
MIGPFVGCALPPPARRRALGFLALPAPVLAQSRRALASIQPWLWKWLGQLPSSTQQQTP